MNEIERVNPKLLNENRNCKLSIRCLVDSRWNYCSAARFDNSNHLAKREFDAIIFVPICGLWNFEFVEHGKYIRTRCHLRKECNDIALSARADLTTKVNSGEDREIGFCGNS